MIARATTDDSSAAPVYDNAAIAASATAVGTMRGNVFVFTLGANRNPDDFRRRRSATTGAPGRSIGKSCVAGAADVQRGKEHRSSSRMVRSTVALRHSR